MGYATEASRIAFCSMLGQRIFQMRRQHWRIAFGGRSGDPREIDPWGVEMLLNPSALHDHLRHPIDAAAREAYLTFANARLPEGLTVRATGHGYIARELRFEFQGKWLFSAVLNQKWVLWYFRKPAMNEGLVDPELTRARFQTAERNDRGEIKLRIRSSKEAVDVLEWISINKV